MKKANVVITVLAFLSVVVFYKMHSREGLTAAQPTVPDTVKPKVLGKLVLTDVNGNDSNALILSVT